MTKRQDKKTINNQSKPKRLTDKEMRELLTGLKKEADKTPEEKGSFSLEVICNGKDMHDQKNK